MTGPFGQAPLPAVMANAVARAARVGKMATASARARRVGTTATASARATEDDKSTVMKGVIPKHDIAIVGGGMVGMALGCALASMSLTKHLNIAIIDSNPALGQKVSFQKNEIPDPRVSAVTPATISFFKEIGAWEYVKEQRHAIFDKMQVWDYTGLGFTRYNAQDVGKEYLGCIVENKVLHYSLLSSLQSNAEFQKTIYAARLNSLSIPSLTSYTISKPEESGLKDTSSEAHVCSGGKHEPHGCFAELELSDGSKLHAKLVVGADGGKSRVRETVGPKTSGWNYSQSALVCTVEHGVENHCAWQRFLPSGPIALLPIGDKFSNIVWSMSPEQAAECKSMSPEDFVKSVNHALNYGYGPYPHSGILDQYLGKIGLGSVSTKEDFQVPPKALNVASERTVFPLSLMHVHDYVSRRVALVGDAAHTVHPLAGQGVNLGFGDAFSLSNVIAEGISVGMDIGELSLLRKYERERKAANVAMMAILDGFQKAFSVDLGPLNILRAAAFHSAQYITPLKRNIISYATGDQKWPLFA